ncbi:MAG: efflux RND transporter periplasmic adaptor subunit [Rhodobacter sp.]|nr:efflux RND transporter periplasmic adaptor subunit [Paracoccaceae bacterium]MCC0076880.1 efflux RND transporter periplasmic adaptor subunit [Rhodobacter sp.]
MTDTRNEIARTLATAKPRRGWLWAVAVALVALVAAGGWFWVSRVSDSRALNYVTDPVRRGTLTMAVTATGTVQPTTQVDVSSELSGRLATVEVDYNDQVEPGQVLARLDDTRFQALVANAEAARDAAQSRVSQAEVTLAEAQTDFDTQEQLDQRGVVSHAAYLSAAAARQRAQAALAIARADLTVAEANLDLQRSDLDSTVIRSPIRGVVLDRAADAGQIVAASLTAPTLFTIAEDLTRMELRVNIDEADIGRIGIDQQASFTVDAFPGRAFSAQVTQVRYAPEITDGVVTYKAILVVDNSDLLLRPGMTATASITVARHEDALLVPNVALRFVPPQVTEESSSGGAGLLGLLMPHRTEESTGRQSSTRSVWVLRDGVPVEVPVVPGDNDSRDTVILSGELAEGDAVITDAQSGR